PILLQGAKLTILVTLGSLLLSTVLGLVWALMRVSGIKPLAKFSAGMINVLRGIPIIVLLFYIYFVMPDMGIAMTAVQAAIIGLGIAYSAYQAENFRAGIEAIDRGQIEAAMAMGMSWSMTMRRVVLPQAVKIVLPPYGNIMIMMLKDSSQASTITVAELALQGKLIAVSTFKNATVFSLVALMYLVMCVPLILLVRHLAKRSAAKWFCSKTYERAVASSKCSKVSMPKSARVKSSASSGPRVPASRPYCAASTGWNVTTAAASPSMTRRSIATPRLSSPSARRFPWCSSGST